LAKRKIRPVAHNESHQRDVLEIEKLNKGGPIALADHLIENDTDDIVLLHDQIDKLFKRLEIKV